MGVWLLGAYSEVCLDEYACCIRCHPASSEHRPECGSATFRIYYMKSTIIFPRCVLHSTLGLRLLVFGARWPILDASVG